MNGIKLISPRWQFALFFNIDRQNRANLVLIYDKKLLASSSLLNEN